MKKQNKFPNFNKMTYKEEAEWWDTHDITDFEDELEDVEIVVALKKPRDKTLVVRLQDELKKKLERIARSKGLNVSTLARMWLMEKLHAAK